MDFMEAVKAMEGGKKVRRPFMEFFYMLKKGSKGILVDNNGTALNVAICLKDYEATDWEIVEEKKPLNGKRMHAFHYERSNELIIMGNPTKDNVDKFVERGFLSVDDVKEALNDLVEWIMIPDGKGCCPDCKSSGSTPKCKEPASTMDKIREIFGRELIE